MRSVLPMAFQEIGKGYTALESFCYIMKCHHLTKRNNYDKVLDKLHGPYMLSGQGQCKIQL